MTIAEASKKYEITADTLRYYEKIGLLPNVRRKTNGIRDYNEEDCRWIEFIKCMRDAGIEIEALIKYVTLFYQGDETREARRQILAEQREKLFIKMSKIEKSLERLNYKIESYSTHLLETEKELK